MENPQYHNNANESVDDWTFDEIKTAFPLTHLTDLDLKTKL